MVSNGSNDSISVSVVAVWQCYISAVFLILKLILCCRTLTEKMESFEKDKEGSETQFQVIAITLEQQHKGVDHS